MVRLYALGECTIDIGGVRIRPDSEVLFALLLYLVVERGRRVPRARLLELLWPGEEDERARHNLRQALYKAKQLGAVVRQEEGDVVLPAPEAWADYDALLGAADGDVPSSISVETVEFLPAYARTPSEELAEWLDGHRAIVHSAVRRHLVARIGRARRLARWRELERLARRCLVLDPMNEEAVVGLAEATAVTGSKALAAAILDRYLADLGSDAKLLGRPARELRRRILDTAQEDVATRAVFVGRDDELAFLAARLDRAIEGEGGSVLIWGEPGIGKTALLRQFAALARLRGATVAQVYGQYAATPQPLSTYTALVDALLELPGALGCAPEALDHCRLLTGSRSRDGEAPPEDADRLQRRIQESVTELARAVAEEAPLLICVEDVHWADDSSIERLAGLAHALREVRVLTVLTGRQHLGHRWPEPSVGRLAIQELRGLSPPAAGALLSSRFDTEGTVSSAYIEWCLHLAHGHPLYLRELGDRWRTVGEQYDMPPSLASLLITRLDTLSPMALRALRLCALLGRDSNLRRLEEALSIPFPEFTSVVEELEIADVAVVEHDAFVLRHDMLGDAALARAGEATRRTLHKRLAVLLEKEVCTGTSAALTWRCAQHWLLAGEQERAGRAVQAAATRFIRIGLPKEAADVLRSLLAARVGQAERDSALRLLLEAEQCLGHWHKVLSSELASSSLNQPTTPSHDSAELNVREAAWRAEHLDLSALLASAEDCLCARDAAPDHRLRSAFQALVFCDELYDSEAYRRIGAIVSSDFPLREQSELDTVRVHLLLQAIRGDLEEAVRLCRRSVVLAERDGNPVVLAHCLRNAAIPLRATSRLAEARIFGEKALALALATGIPDGIQSAATSLALTQLLLGDLVSARRLSDQALECVPSLEPLNGRSACKIVSCVIALFSGDLQGAVRFADEVFVPKHTTTCRYSLEALAVRAISASIRRDETQVTSLLPLLLDGFERTAGWGGEDNLAYGIALSLRCVRRRREADAFLSRYASTRRERFPMLPLPI